MDLEVEVLLERWEERAAFLEFSAELPRAEAELEASRQCFDQDALPQPVAALRSSLAAARKSKKKKKKRR